jgi:hypothetical protein
MQAATGKAAGASWSFETPNSPILSLPICTRPSRKDEPPVFENQNKKEENKITIRLRLKNAGRIVRQ